MWGGGGKKNKESVTGSSYRKKKRNRTSKEGKGGEGEEAYCAAVRSQIPSLIKEGNISDGRKEREEKTTKIKIPSKETREGKCGKRVSDMQGDGLPKSTKRVIIH